MTEIRKRGARRSKEGLTGTAGTGSGDGGTGGQEETCTDGSTDGNHDHVAQAKITLETLLLWSKGVLAREDIVHLIDVVLFFVSLHLRHCCCFGVVSFLLWVWV